MLSNDNSRVSSWEVDPLLAEYILGVWKGLGRVEEVSDNSDALAAFRARAALAFMERGFSFKRIRTWVNVMPPSQKTGYAKGYPHKHVNERALTLIHYVDVGDKPPALDIFDSGKVVESFVPQTGETVFIPNGIVHGVHRNNGTRPRLAMIATAYT